MILHSVINVTQFLVSVVTMNVMRMMMDVLTVVTHLVMHILMMMMNQFAHIVALDVMAIVVSLTVDALMYVEEDVILIYIILDRNYNTNYIHTKQKQMKKVQTHTQLFSLTFI